MKSILLPAWLAGVLVSVVLLGGTAPALAQLDSREAIDLRNQISELRRDVQGLREQMSRGGGSSSLGSARSAPAAVAASPASDVTAALLERVAQLEDRVRELQGKIDTEQNARTMQGADLQKNIDDMAFKLGQGATPAQAPVAASPQTTSPPPKPLGAPPAAPARRTPEVAMQEGNAALARRDYAAAEAAAKEVMAFPKSPRATDAQFLLAQSLNGKKDWAGAAIAYDDTYNRARTGTHAQDALLGEANALTALNEKRAACATLERLKAEFPSPRADLRDSVSAARQKAGCR